MAELHVTELTGLPLSSAGGPPSIAAVGPGAWAGSTVEDWRFLLAEMTSAPSPGAAPGAATLSELGLPEGLFGSGEDGEELIAGLMSTMAPVLAAMQFGSAVGHLARSTLGQYELPIPRVDATRLLVVPANVTRFAADWSLTADDVRLWVCVRELTLHAVLTRPHVTERMPRPAAAGGEWRGAGRRWTVRASGRHRPDRRERARAADARAGRAARHRAVARARARRRRPGRRHRRGARVRGARPRRRRRATARGAGRAGRGLATSAQPERFERRRSGGAVRTRRRAGAGRTGRRVRPRCDRSQRTGGPDAAVGLGRGLPTPSEVDAPGLWLERLQLDDPDPDPDADPGADPDPDPGADDRGGG